MNGNRRVKISKIRLNVEQMFDNQLSIEDHTERSPIVGRYLTLKGIEHLHLGDADSGDINGYQPIIVPLDITGSDRHNLMQKLKFFTHQLPIWNEKKGDAAGLIPMEIDEKYILTIQELDSYCWEDVRRYKVSDKIGMIF